MYVDLCFLECDEDDIVKKSSKHAKPHLKRKKTNIDKQTLK